MQDSTYTSACNPNSLRDQGPTRNAIYNMSPNPREIKRISSACEIGSIKGRNLSLGDEEDISDKGKAERFANLLSHLNSCSNLCKPKKKKSSQMKQIH
jgi:hypothetical protein